MQVTPTGSFLRSLKRVSKADADDTIAALELFLVDPHAKSLNFERVKSKRGISRSGRTVPSAYCFAKPRRGRSIS
jgi:hypothetical protein